MRAIIGTDATGARVVIGVASVADGVRFAVGQESGKHAVFILPLDAVAELREQAAAAASEHLEGMRKELSSASDRFAAAAKLVARMSPTAEAPPPEPSKKRA